MEGPKLLNFKIGGPKLQNDENRGTKTAIKPKINNDILPFLLKTNLALGFVVNLESS